MTNLTKHVLARLDQYGSPEPGLYNLTAGIIELCLYSVTVHPDGVACALAEMKELPAELRKKGDEYAQ